MCGEVGRGVRSGAWLDSALERQVPSYPVSRFVPKTLEGEGQDLDFLHSSKGETESQRSNQCACPTLEKSTVTP